MKKYLMAIDAGTGSVRAVLFDLEGNQIGCSQHEWTHNEDPRFPGSMDFDWTFNWKLASSCVRNVLAETGIDPTEIAAISTTCMIRTETRSGPAPMSTPAAQMKSRS